MRIESWPRNSRVSRILRKDKQCVRKSKEPIYTIVTDTIYNINLGYDTLSSRITR